MVKQDQNLIVLARRDLRNYSCMRVYTGRILLSSVRTLRILRTAYVRRCLVPLFLGVSLRTFVPQWNWRDTYIFLAATMVAAPSNKRLSFHTS